MQLGCQGIPIDNFIYFLLLSSTCIRIAIVKENKSIIVNITPMIANIVVIIFL